MRFMQFLAIVAQIAMLIYVTNAACVNQRGSKRKAIRAGALTAVLLIGFASTLQFMVPDHAFVAVREIAQLGFIASCVAVAIAVGLLKRSLAACDKRTRDDAGR